MNSLARDRTTRRIKVLTELQVKPFQTIGRNVTKELGSERAAHEALGVSVTVFRSLMLEGYLTDKMAHVILAKRKEMKAK